MSAFCRSLSAGDGLLAHMLGNQGSPTTTEIRDFGLPFLLVEVTTR
jgi:hypothetical protein